MLGKQVSTILLILLLVTILSPLLLNASLSQTLVVTSNGPIEWSKPYAGGNAESMIQTSDGGYAVAGPTFYYEAPVGADSEFWLVKTDADGNELWNKKYNVGEEANSVIQSNDGGYAIAGGTIFNSRFSTFILVKIDANGNVRWSRTYGLPAESPHALAYSVIQTNDGGYALGGTGEWGCWLVKTDAVGNKLWNRTYEGREDFSHFSQIQSLIQTSDGGYALVGYIFNYSTFTATSWFAKTDTSGNILWNKTYDFGRFNTVIQTSDERYVLSSDDYLVKTDANGNLLWNKTVQGSCMVQTQDGGYAETSGNSLVKVDAAGNQQWNKTYSISSIKSMVQTTDGGYALVVNKHVNSSYNGIWIIKIPPDKPPITTLDYEDLWYTNNLTLNLTATDDFTNVSDTYYKINDEQIRTVNINGQPTIVTESVNNRIEYWSIDGLGLEESPHKMLTGIKLDKTAPTGSITINNGNVSTFSSSVRLSLSFLDNTSGVSQVRYSNDDTWNNITWEVPSVSKLWTLTVGDGTKTVYYQIKDNAGLISSTYSDTITVVNETIPEFSSITLTIILVIATIFAFLTKKCLSNTKGFRIV